jgi:uncharacterized RDD family membrane protein YckC
MENVEQNNTPASKGLRFACLLIDFLVLPFVLAIIVVILSVVAYSVLGESEAVSAIAMILIVPLFSLWCLIRDLVFSPARKLLKLKLISLKDGSKPSLGQVLLRNVFFIIPILNQATAFIDCIAVLAIGDRAGDRIAKTRVVLK